MNERAAKQQRKNLHRMVDVVSDAYLDDLSWTVQQYAAKSLNEGTEEAMSRKPK